MPIIGGRRNRSSLATPLPSREVMYRWPRSLRALAVPASSSSRAVPVALGAPGSTLPRRLQTVTTTSGLRRIRLTFHASASDTMISSSPSGTCQTGVATGVPSLR
jgi:hypothetical protein